MRDEQNEKGRCGGSTSNRWTILTVGILLLLAVPTAPARVEAVVGHDYYSPTLSYPITCSNPVMKSAPRFLTAPKGSAKFPFTSYCTSPDPNVPGAMTLRWEGSWTPSETRPDRPNASESITVTSYADFFPGREPGERGDPGAKIFMYWTARCDGNPWLEPSTCDRFGGYVPDDVRQALSQIDHERFPLTWKSISPSLKKHLLKQYQAANQPVSTQSRVQNMASQPQQSQRLTQSQRAQAMIQQPQQSQTIITKPQQAQAMTEQPQAVPQNPNARVSDLTRSGIFRRGVEETEGQTSGRKEKDPHPASVETSDMAVLEEGTQEMVDQTAVALDRPLHVTTAKGEAVVLEPAIYEIELILNLQLGLAKEGHQTVLLPANTGTHNESIPRAMALVIPGQSNDEQHLVLLTPDGKRFDALGSTSGVRSRGIGQAVPLLGKTIQDAISQTSAQSASEPPPPCQQNSEPIGPRWLPVPCTMPSIPAIPTVPVP